MKCDYKIKFFKNTQHNVEIKQTTPIFSKIGGRCVIFRCVICPQPYKDTHHWRQKFTPI